MALKNEFSDWEITAEGKKGKSAPQHTIEATSFPERRVGAHLIASFD